MSNKSLQQVKKMTNLGVSILNGIVGDSLQNTPLGIDMGFYEQNKRIHLDKNSLSERYIQSNASLSSKICILIHGTTENEATWKFRDKSDYGSLLAQDFQYTPFYLRYNTGCHISDNGKALAAILEELYQNYPVDIEEISIIAHSMGGLVAHSACHYAQENRLVWASKIKNVFLLGVPHLGSFLERFANLTTNILEKVPNWHTRLVGKVLNLRSAGIKDLRYGYLRESDWKNQDPDRLLQNNKTPPRILPNASYYVISARLTENEKHWISQLFGDILVTQKSATARSKNAAEFNFSPAHHYELAKTYHFQLQASEKVYEKINTCIKKSLENH